MPAMAHFLHRIQSRSCFSLSRNFDEKCPKNGIHTKSDGHSCQNRTARKNCRPDMATDLSASGIATIPNSNEQSPRSKSSWLNVPGSLIHSAFIRPNACRCASNLAKKRSAKRFERPGGPGTHKGRFFFVPEGHSPIAHRFIGGNEAPSTPCPGGTFASMFPTMGRPSLRDEQQGRSGLVPQG